MLQRDPHAGSGDKSDRLSPEAADLEDVTNQANARRTKTRRDRSIAGDQEPDT
jgi:hypothetical protein